MASEPKRTSAKIEVFIIGAFFLIFTFWAFNKCSNTRSLAKQKAEKERLFKEQEDSIKLLLQQKGRPKADNPAPGPVPSAGLPDKSAYSKLYVSIGGLKMRRAPELNAEVIDEFELFEEVFFLNEVTDFTQEINLGKQIVNEPWIKVQSKQGRAGWVYGAGVHYYKKKHPGAD